MNLVQKLSERQMATDPAGAISDFSFAYDLFLLDAEASSYGVGRPGADEFLCRLFQKEFSDPKMRILTLDGERVGFYCLTSRDYEVELRGPYVDPALQGQGIEDSIVAKALETAREAGLPLVVSVPEGSKAVRALMDAGFEISGDRELFFGEETRSSARSLSLRVRQKEEDTQPSGHSYPAPRI